MLLGFVYAKDSENQKGSQMGIKKAHVIRRGLLFYNIAKNRQKTYAALRNMVRVSGSYYTNMASHGKVKATNRNDFVKSRNFIKFVIPAKAGIQLFQGVLDPGFRRGDASRDFLRDHQP